MEIPKPIKDFIKQRVPTDFSPDTCKTCNGGCCTGPGFALLENVIEIFQLYESNGLQREDYLFEKGLNLCTFIFKYFDRVYFNNSLLVFFPKVFSENDAIISIPPWNYYQARDYIHRRIVNRGCIFLNKKRENNDSTERFCILHNDKIYEEITTKPIDCSFLMCNGSKSVIKPTLQESNLWFAMLDFYFPLSIQRFEQLCPGQLA